MCISCNKIEKDLDSKFIQSYINRKQVWWNGVVKGIKSEYDRIEQVKNKGHKKIEVNNDVNIQSIMKNTSWKYIQEYNYYPSEHWKLANQSTRSWPIRVLEASQSKC